MWCSPNNAAPTSRNSCFWNLFETLDFLSILERREIQWSDLFVVLGRELKADWPGLYNCFIRWVLILSRVCADRCTGRQHSKKHSQTQSLLNEIRDLTQTFHITRILAHRIVTRDHDTCPMLINLRCALWQSTRCLTVSCFQTKPQAKLFQFRADFLKCLLA